MCASVRVSLLGEENSVVEAVNLILKYRFQIAVNAKLVHILQNQKGNMASLTLSTRSPWPLDAAAVSLFLQPVAFFALFLLLSALVLKFLSSIFRLLL